MQLKFFVNFAASAALFAIFAFAVPHAASAAGKRALVIGNAAYPNHNLATPVNDARLLARTLQRNGFNVTQVLNAGANELEAALASFERNSRNASLSVIYFAGLAVQIDKRNYLLPIGLELRSKAKLKRYGIPVSQLLAARSAGPRLLLLDPNAPPSRSRLKGLRPMKPGRNQLIAFGSAPGQWPKGVPGGNGFYARALANHILRPEMDVASAIRGTEQTVIRESRRQQRPWSASTLRQRVPFSGAPPAAMTQSSRPSMTAPAPTSRGYSNLSRDRNTDMRKKRATTSDARKRQQEAARRVARQKQSVARTQSDRRSRAASQRSAARETARKRAYQERSRRTAAKPKPAPPAAAARPPQPASRARSQSTFSSSIKGLKAGSNVKTTKQGRNISGLATNAAPRGDKAKVHIGNAAAAAKTAPKPADVSRFPTIEAPDEVPVGQNFAVQVSLTLDEITPDVKIKPGKGAKITKEGALSLPLPAGEEWEIDVILSAPGFKLASGKNTQKITLPRDDDSTPALFTLAARPIKTATKARKIYATLWHKGAYLAKVIKPISIVNDSATATASPSDRAKPLPLGPEPPQGASKATLISAPAQSAPAPIAVTAEPPQLTVYILHGTGGEDGPAGQIIINSPYLQPAVAPYRAPDDMADWLTSQYDRLLTELTARTSLPLAERTVPMMRGFGQLVYKYFAPDAFKTAFWKLKDRLGSRFTSIQIYSNNPLIPWELMRPRSKDGKNQLDFLGIEYKVARWHIGENTTQLDKPPQRLLLKELVTIAPRYKGKDVLPNQAQEMAVLAKLPGHRAMSGKLSAMRKLFTELPSGIVHFSGHGVIGTEETPKYAIRLEDIELDVVSWRGLAPASPKNHPFIFLNACDIGQARRVANFVDGWAPAVLETGAGGYIGGLWPLSDTAAAGFSNAFYTRLYAKLKEGEVKAAEVLQFARRDFLKTGDPTYLAYAYYGDVNLRFTTR